MHRGRKGFYSITSSARASSIGDTVSPNAFALLRLSTSSNLVGWIPGNEESVAGGAGRGPIFIKKFNWSFPTELGGSGEQRGERYALKPTKDDDGRSDAIAS